MSSGLIVMETDAIETLYIAGLLILTIVFITSITLNIFLVKYIRKQNKEIRRLSNAYMQSSYQKRATQTVVIITVCLVLTHLPQLGILGKAFSNSAHPKDYDRSTILCIHWARLLVLANAGLNALVYISKNRPIIKLCRKYCNSLSIGSLRSFTLSSRNTSTSSQ